MANYSYDSSTDTLELIAGTPRAKLNEATSKAEASLDNQSDYIEAGTVATHAHAVGDFINYGTDKQFAEVTSAIAIGDSIVNGVNVADKSIGGVLSSLNFDLTNINKLKMDVKQSLTTNAGGNIITDIPTSRHVVSAYTENGYLVLFSLNGNAWMFHVMTNGATPSGAQGTFNIRYFYYD